MRLFLLPISTRQSLLYCHRVQTSLPNGARANLVDRLTARVNKQWSDYEKNDSGWQKKITQWGNALFQRLPHEEWGLKSVPPLKREDKEAGADSTASAPASPLAKVEVIFPPGYIDESKVIQSLQKLGSPETQQFHLKWLLGSIVGMPFSAPAALIPIIPNLPFFYLCFRAWSHWRARAGSMHVGFLMDKQLARMRPSPILDLLYAEALLNVQLRKLQADAQSVTQQRTESPSTRTTSETPPRGLGFKGAEREKDQQQTVRSDEDANEEHLLLEESSGHEVAAQLGVPALVVEIERAVWQVRRDIRRAADEQRRQRQQQQQQQQQNSPQTSPGVQQTNRV